MSKCYSQKAFDAVWGIIEASETPMSVNRVAELSGVCKSTALIVVRVLTEATPRTVRITYQREHGGVGRQVRHLDARVDLPDEPAPQPLTQRELNQRHAARRARNPDRMAARKDRDNYGSTITRSMMLSYLQASGEALSGRELAKVLGVAVSSANKAARGLMAADKIRVAGWIVPDNRARSSAKYDTQVDLPSAPRPPRSERRKTNRDAIMEDPIAAERLRAKNAQRERERYGRTVEPATQGAPAFDWRNALNDWGKPSCQD